MASGDYLQFLFKFSDHFLLFLLHSYQCFKRDDYSDCRGLTFMQISQNWFLSDNDCWWSLNFFFLFSFTFPHTIFLVCFILFSSCVWFFWFFLFVPVWSFLFSWFPFVSIGFQNMNCLKMHSWLIKTNDLVLLIVLNSFFFFSFFFSSLYKNCLKL